MRRPSLRNYPGTPSRCRSLGELMRVGGAPTSAPHSGACGTLSHSDPLPRTCLACPRTPLLPPASLPQSRCHCPRPTSHLPHPCRSASCPPSMAQHGEWTLNRFLRVEKVGSGLASSVYRVVDTVSNTQVRTARTAHESPAPLPPGGPGPRSRRPTLGSPPPPRRPRRTAEPPTTTPPRSARSRSTTRGGSTGRYRTA